MKEKPIPYISNYKFSQDGIFQYWAGRLPGHTHVNQVYPDLVRMWRQSHDCPASGGGIERVFFSTGKLHDVLKKKTMDKTLERTLKASINTKLPRKGVQEVVVRSVYSVVLVWFVYFVSKFFVNEIIMIINKYLKNLIVKGLDNQDQFSV